MSQVAVRSDKRFRRAHVKPARQRARWRRWCADASGMLLAAALVFGGYRGAASWRTPTSCRSIPSGGRQRAHARGGGAGGPQRSARAEPALDRSGAWRQPAAGVVLGARSGPASLASVDDRSRDRRTAADRHRPDRRPAVPGRRSRRGHRRVRPAVRRFDLPVIDGFTRRRRRRSDRPTSPDGTRVKVMASLTPKPEIAQRLSQIDVRDAHNARVILNGDPAVIQLGDQQFLPRLQSYLEVAPALRDRVADIDYVDLRFDSRVYVRPAGKPARPERPADGERRAARAMSHSRRMRGRATRRTETDDGAKRAISGRPGRRHLEGDRRRRRNARRRRRSTSWGWVSPSRAAFAAASSSISKRPSIRSRRPSKKPS